MSIKRILLLFIIILPLALTAAYIVFPSNPMGSTTSAYEKHLRFSGGFPFLIKYYLLKPQSYNPNQAYPLVLVLHGADRTTFAGHVLALPEMRRKYPAFVVVPIAPIKSYWATPFPEAKMGGWFPALSHAVGTVESVQQGYKIDPSRIYITGNSMGGFGTFGAVVKNPLLFAAAMPTCGGWDTADARAMVGTSVRAYHGAKDNMIPVTYTRNLVSSLKAAGGNVEYIEYPNGGHDCQITAYKTYEAWDWLFSQRR